MTTTRTPFTGSTRLILETLARNELGVSRKEIPSSVLLKLQRIESRLTAAGQEIEKMPSGLIHGLNTITQSVETAEERSARNRDRTAAEIAQLLNNDSTPLRTRMLELDEERQNLLSKHKLTHANFKANEQAVLQALKAGQSLPEINQLLQVCKKEADPTLQEAKRFTEQARSLEIDAKHFIETNVAPNMRRIGVVELTPTTGSSPTPH